MAKGRIPNPDTSPDRKNGFRANERNYTIDKCENCGFISYSVIARCPVCGNMILTGEKILKKDWMRGAVKEKLNEGKRKDS